MPEMIPVGNTIQPPNAGQTLSNLSSIYGIQQQRIGLQQQQQALQTGQYLQQTAQAESEQSQQKNRELQALSQFTRAASKDPKYLNSDGSLNVQKFQQDASAVAPTYGLAYIGQSTINANEAIQSRKTLLSLSNEQRTTAGQYLAAEAANPNASASSWQAAVSRARSLSNDKGYQDMLDSMLTHAPQTAGMSDQEASNSIRDFARQVSVQVGAPNAALSAPTMSDYTTPDQKIGQRQTNPLAVMPQGPQGPVVAQGVGPGETPQFKASVASATGRATGVASADLERQGQVSAAIAPSRAALPLTYEIDDLADQIHSGKFTAAISNAAAALGDSADTYARQILAKDLGQVQSRATDHAPTDEARKTILSGYPEPTSDARTIHSAMDYVRGSLKVNLMRGDNLISHRDQHPDLAGFQQSDDQITNSIDPLKAEFRSLKRGSPEWQSFLKRRFDTPEKAQAFIDGNR